MRRLMPAVSVLTAGIFLAVGCTRNPPFQHLARPGRATLVAYHADLAAVPRFTILRDPPRHPPRPTVTVSRHSPYRPHNVTVTKPGPGGLLWRIAVCESHGNWTAQNRSSSASGAWQVLDSTWAGAYNVAHSRQATPAEQTAFVTNLYAHDGTRPWAASEGCWR